MSAALIIAVLLPALTGGALTAAAALGAGHRADRVAVPVGLSAATLTALAATIAAARHAAARGGVPALLAGTGQTLQVDSLAALVLPVVAWVAVLVLVFAAADRVAPSARFFGLMLIFLAAVIITVTVTAVPVLLAGWEIMGATSYALIGFWWQQPRRVTGGFTAFTVTRAGDLGMYLAAGAIVAGHGTWSLTGVAHLTGGWADVAAGGLLAAGLGKAAQLPFSFWISRAMEGPSAVSALLHSAAMVAMGGYLLLRVAPLLAATGWAALVAAWVGVATAILLGVIAIAQTDLKQLLAASTASQLGFVVLAAGVGSVRGGAVQLLAHAATKALLFLTAGAWLSATGTKQFTGLRGVIARWPAVGVLATIGGASLAGLPPLSLWYGKDVVLAAALQQSPWLYAAGLVGAVVSAAYAGRMLLLLWKPAGSPEQVWDEEQPGSRRVPAAAVAPMIILAAGAAGFALLGLGTLQHLLSPLPGPDPSAAELAASGGLAGIVVALILWRPPRPLPAARHWFGMQHAADLLVGAPTARAARALAAADDHFTAQVDRIPAALTAAAVVAWRLDEAALSAVGGVGVAVSALGRLARRSQTGQLHQYYIAAAVTLAAAAMLLIAVR